MVVLGIIIYILYELIFHNFCKKEQYLFNSINDIWEDHKSNNIIMNIIFIILYILSVGYLFAYLFKGKSEGDSRKKYIKRCNIYNLLMSFIFLLITYRYFYLYSYFEYFSFLSLLQFFNGYRFISRSIEISLAFGKDVFAEENKSNLNKIERLKLAISSYLEIYIFSASFYITIMSRCDTNFMIMFKSSLLSLSVGTLTNVAYSQLYGLLLNEFLQILPFFQVFSTLSLVVLSLTMYISREK